MPDTNSRRDFLRNTLGVAVLASTSPIVVLGHIVPTLSKSTSGQLVATYVVKLEDYPQLDQVGGSVKLTDPAQLFLNPDHRDRSFTGKDFPIAITRVAEAGEDAFKAVSTYCSHGFDYQVRDYNPITNLFVCPHRGSSFTADGTHVVKPNTPNVGDLRKFPAVYDVFSGTITLDRVLGVASIDPAGGVPSQVFLDQNYPNPFNPATLIRYGLPKAMHITLTVHRLDGELIDTIVDDPQQAGSYTVDYSARDIPSGTYFYRLQCADGTFVRRMVVRK